MPIYVVADWASYAICYKQQHICAWRRQIIDEWKRCSMCVGCRFFVLKNMSGKLLIASLYAGEIYGTDRS